MAEQDIRLNVITLDFGNELGEDESDEEETPDDIITDYDETLGLL